MFRTAYQRGFLTVFFSCGSKPLEIWEVHMENGHISRLLDPDIKSMVLDIRGNNVSTAYITCPTKNRILGITMPFMIMVVKNLKKYFTFEVTILDDTGSRRRFRVSNFQSTTQIMPMCTAMPIGLADGWNQIQFNLSEFTRRAYNKSFVEVQKIKVNANIRLRRIYFAEKLTPEEDLPPEYRIFLPLPSKVGKGKKGSEGEASKTTIIKHPSSKAMSTSQSKLRATSRASIVDLPETVPPAEAVPPPEGEKPPAAGDVTPAAEEPASTEVEATPEESVATPAEGEEVEAPMEEAVPTEGADNAVAAEGPPAEETAPPAEEAAPPAEEAAPPPDEAAPPAE